mmetsp:Transcript_16715/g.21743  ORF Transcript_16715/g.21743 Transcript_16715/m.21743 type:complete len:156 (+) Transcript_16715:587-1054(+)
MFNFAFSTKEKGQRTIKDIRCELVEKVYDIQTAQKCFNYVNNITSNESPLALTYPDCRLFALFWTKLYTVEMGFEIILKFINEDSEGWRTWEIMYVQYTEEPNYITTDSDLNKLTMDELSHLYHDFEYIENSNSQFKTTEMGLIIPIELVFVPIY